MIPPFYDHATRLYSPPTHKPTTLLIPTTLLAFTLFIPSHRLTNPPPPATLPFPLNLANLTIPCFSLVNPCAFLATPFSVTLNPCFSLPEKFLLITQRINPMTNNIASQDELLASMGLSTNSTNPTNSTKRKNNFLTNQYPIFSTPVCSVYLQGSASVSLASLTSEEEFLAKAPAVSIFRKIGANSNPSILSILEELKTNKHLLFNDKAFHKQIVVKLVEAGVSIDPAKAVSKSFALAAIDSYLQDLAVYLADSNLTLEAFIESTLPKEKRSVIDSTMSQADFDALFDQL